MSSFTCSENIQRKAGVFTSSENIQRKEGVPDRSVSNNQFSSVTLNELAIKTRDQRGHTVISSFNMAVKPKGDKSSKGVRIDKSVQNI